MTSPALPQNHPQRGVLSVACLAMALCAFALPASAGESNTSGYSFEKVTDEKWTFVPMYSFSSLSGGRPSWNEYDGQLFYKINPNLVVGAEVDVRDRPPAGTDTLISALVSYTPWKPLELHAEITATPDASFSASQIYLAGFELRATSHISVLFDYQHYEYRNGAINQIKPGIRYWFSDETYFTLRYASGWAFDNIQYNSFGGNLTLGLPGKRRLDLGYWRGNDPEWDIQAPNAITVSGNTYSAYFHQPIRKNVDLIVGAEYETNRYYKRTTGSIGLAIKF